MTYEFLATRWCRILLKEYAMYEDEGVMMKMWGKMYVIMRKPDDLMIKYSYKFIGGSMKWYQWE